MMSEDEEKRYASVLHAAARSGNNEVLEAVLEAMDRLIPDNKVFFSLSVENPQRYLGCQARRALLCLCGAPALRST